MDSVSPVSLDLRKLPIFVGVLLGTSPQQLSSAGTSEADTTSGSEEETDDLGLVRIDTPYPKRQDSPASRRSSLRSSLPDFSVNTVSSASESHSREAVQQQIWGLAKERFELLQFLFDVASILSFSAAILCTIPNVLVVTVVALTVISHLFAEPTTERPEEDAQPSRPVSPTPSELAAAGRNVSFAPLPPPIRPVNVDQPCPWDISKLASLVSQIKVAHGLREETQPLATLAVTRVLEFLAAVGLKNPLARFDAMYNTVTCTFPPGLGAHRNEADDLSFGPFKISTKAKSIRNLTFAFAVSLETEMLVAVVQQDELSTSQPAYFVVKNTETGASHHVEKIEFDPANNEIRFFGKVAPSSGSSSPGSWEHISEVTERMGSAPRSSSPEIPVRKTEILYATNFEDARELFSGFLS